MKTHNLRDRFGSRTYHLHIIGFHEGQLKPGELITELEKVEKYLDVIRELVGVKGWLGNVWVRKRISSRGMYIRSTSDILPKWKDMRNSYIPLNWNDMRSIADITKLSESRIRLELFKGDISR